MKFGFFNTGFPRITFAFALVIIIVIANVCFNYYIIRKNKATIAEMTEVINPYVEALEKLNLIVTESKMYSTNWVYLQNSIDDKKNLDSLLKTQYPAIKKKLDTQLLKLNKKADADSLVDVFLKIFKLEQVEKEIMSTLVSFDDYENAQKKFKCEELVESEILPRTQSIKAQLKGIIHRNREAAFKMKASIQKDSDKMTTFMLLASVGLFVFIMAAVSFISGGIRKPVLKMKNIIQQLGRGELPDEKLEAKKNVIGDMVSSVNALSESFTQTSVFATEIGKGNLKAHYDKLSENDLLGNALINMRDSLRSYSENMEEQVRLRTVEVVEKSGKLENAYREIRDSINYAKRIQESILPADETIATVFANSFIFYKPKDVVCGDFYWFSQKGDDAIIAALDCTGHGVPGAFMTVIGNSLMNQIVNFSEITGPSQILSQLDKRLHETLKQSGNVITNDGMDAAICRYKISKSEITFSGAKRPLYIFKKGELIEIKGNKSPIGSFGHELDKTFSEHKIKINPTDTLYMFSDGLQDQFGGHDGKKFMIKRFRDLLVEIQPLSMKEQGKRVEKEIRDWQKDFEQTDDMLLIGIRF
ncbi:MAG: SpoIIE family protein phosphatase [Bacteroidia bacterium]|nr:SpoIIE family protein phosphatase [Bacteroidia bacterium]